MDVGSTHNRSSNQIPDLSLTPNQLLSAYPVLITSSHLLPQISWSRPCPFSHIFIQSCHRISTAPPLKCIHNSIASNSLHHLHPGPATFISVLGSLPWPLVRLFPMRPPEGARQHLTSLTTLTWLRGSKVLTVKTAPLFLLCPQLPLTWLQTLASSLFHKPARLGPTSGPLYRLLALPEIFQPSPWLGPFIYLLSFSRGTILGKSVYNIWPICNNVQLAEFPVASCLIYLPDFLTPWDKLSFLSAFPGELEDRFLVQFCSLLLPNTQTDTQ